MYTFVPGKPWLTVDGKYLLYDFVHLIKNIRNLWLTEKTVLRVFSEKTYAALLQHPDMIYSDVNDTAIFINKVIIWWKICVKAIGADTRHNDPSQAVINNPNDNRLNLILQFGDMALKMAGPKGKRIKQLSKDIATCIHQTCYGLVDLCRYLLNTMQNYVLLGQFTSDHLEKEYSILRQGSHIFLVFNKLLKSYVCTFTFEVKCGY